MTTTRVRYWLLSALSGIFWALLVLALSRPSDLRLCWGPLIVSPFIGLIIGELARPWIRTHIIWLAYGALFNLYLASGLYGFATGLYSWCAGQGLQGETFESALRGAGEAALTCALGINISLLVVLLWPVAIANHFWLGYFSAESRCTRSSPRRAVEARPLPSAADPLRAPPSRAATHLPVEPHLPGVPHLSATWASR